MSISISKRLKMSQKELPQNGNQMKKNIRNGVKKMEDLVESILDYVRSDYTDYAVMINGEWGVGKTHFWNNKIRKKMEKDTQQYTCHYMEYQI